MSNLSGEFIITIENLLREAPAGWLGLSCDLLCSLSPTASVEFVLQRLPVTNNANLSLLMSNTIRQASSQMSWEALSRVIESSAVLHRRMKSDKSVELLWSGPSPENHIPARRIDQVLYDLINSAQHDILLVTFAAYKIKRLSEALSSALSRGVTVRLILEFEESSNGQLSYDAVKAFPLEIQNKAEIYYWPLEMRELNTGGKPGKLHAKVAVVDDQALISSANLTDDAFIRNLELGALFMGNEIPMKIRDYIKGLCAENVLTRWTSTG